MQKRVGLWKRLRAAGTKDQNLKRRLKSIEDERLRVQEANEKQRELLRSINKSRFLNAAFNSGDLFRNSAEQRIELDTKTREMIREAKEAEKRQKERELVAWKESVHRKEIDNAVALSEVR